MSDNSITGTVNPQYTTGLCICDPFRTSIFHVLKQFSPWECYEIMSVTFQALKNSLSTYILPKNA